MAIIRVTNLRRLFGPVVAVNDVNLTISKGEVFGFLGPNGSGKTTVIRMLTGIIPPTSGTALVDGIDVTVAPEAVRERIGYMSQAFSLYGDLTALENLEFYARVYGVPRRRRSARIGDIVDQVGLRPCISRLTASLSGGWKQRLALGCAMMHAPRVMFLDEPTAGVDPVARRELWDLLFAVAAEGITLFVTTHHMDEAERCSHIAYIYNGNVIADGTPEELREDPGVLSRGVRSFEITSTNVTAALQQVCNSSAVRSATAFGNSIRVLVDESVSQEEMQYELESLGVLINDIKPIRLGLEEIFIELTRRQRVTVGAVLG